MKSFYSLKDLNPIQGLSKHAILSALALCTLAFSSAPALALDKVVLRINFTPWGMHAQYFGGRAQGFYKAEGIDLEIRPPAAGQQNEVMIATGREQFDIGRTEANCTSGFCVSIINALCAGSIHC